MAKRLTIVAFVIAVIGAAAAAMPDPKPAFAPG
jgi:hypothetical protein